MILLNGTAKRDDLPDEIYNDPRVEILEDRTGNTNVGYLKNVAFNKATGDVLVEVDHDDLLTPDCLGELYEAFNGDQSVGFVYSNNAKLSDNFTPYNPVFGWEHRKHNFRDRELFEMISFPPSAASLGYIWYSPDHVRAWRTTAYKEIGGHNPELSVCDDHELMIRTYLKTKMHLINKCLYIYRITGTNTWIERNKLIQDTTRSLFNRYAQLLAERDAELQGLMKVDIGGGLFPRAGYTTIDQQDADFVCDLNDGIPLPDNSVGVLNASHIIEHLRDKHKTMCEIHRVLADGGWAFIEVPSTDGRGAFQDPTHVSYWNQNSFLYYTSKAQAQFIRNTTVRFQSFRCETGFPTEWWRENHVSVVWAWLRAIKSDARRPHGTYI